MNAPAEAVAEVGRAIRTEALAHTNAQWLLAFRRRCACADEALLIAGRAVLAGESGARMRLRDAVETRERLRDELLERVGASR